MSLFVAVAFLPLCQNSTGKAVFLKERAPVAQGRKIKELTLRLDHLYYPAEELIFKDSNNVACLACTF